MTRTADRPERLGWFWVFLLASVALHAALLVRAPWRGAAATVAAEPPVMAVQLVEVQPAPPAPEPEVLPEPVAPPVVVVEQPVPTPPPAPVATPPPVARPRPPVAAAPRVVAPAPPPAAAPVEARPHAQGNRPPHYPDIARRNGWQGLCLLRVTVDAQGRPGQVTVARSSGYGILDQAAVTAVRRWKFSPRTVGGQPVASTVEVPVNFSLR